MERELPTTREEADDPPLSSLGLASGRESYFRCATLEESHGFGNVATRDDPEDLPPPLERDPGDVTALPAAAAPSGGGMEMIDDDEFPALGAQPAKPVKRKRATGLGNLGNTCFVSPFHCTG